MNMNALGLYIWARYGGGTPPPPGTWILAANTWDDSGVWLDAETWND